MKEINEKISNIEWSLSGLTNLMDKLELTTLEQYVLNERIESLKSCIKALRTTAQAQKE